MPDPILTARARVGVATRTGTPDDVAAARRDLRAALLERSAREATAVLPALTEEQARRIASVIYPPAVAR